MPQVSSLVCKHVDSLLFPRTSHTQVDNASDNKNRWVLGFFAWVIKQGWVTEVRVSMMMVGHTHEDIDALFKLIVELWRRLRRVLSPSDFHQMLQEAIPSAVVHQFLEYVHDWADFFSECIYDSVHGLNTAREFIIRERADGGAQRPMSNPNARLAV